MVLEQKINKIYQQKIAKKKQLFNLKNKCFAIIYKYALEGKNPHKELLKLTINYKKLAVYMLKIAKKASKVVDKRKNAEENAIILLGLFSAQQFNNGAKKLINHDLMEQAEIDKKDVITSYIDESRYNERWLYLASSHDDSAEDHRPYQGRLYVDNKAPAEILAYAHNRGLNTLQWVMGAPVWFITRPNCRHFFKSLKLEDVDGATLKELIRKNKMHRLEGDRSLQTPKKIVVEEYTDRLRMLQAMYKEHPTEHLRREIQKIKLLIKKWENRL